MPQDIKIFKLGGEIMSCFNILLYAFFMPPGIFKVFFNVHDFYGQGWGSMDHKGEKNSNP